MTVTVNGITREVPADSCVASVVGALTTASSGVAVAVNGEVVRRGEWPAYTLHDGDRVEVLTAAQGG